MARDIKMRVTILTGSDELNLSLKRYLGFIFREEVKQVFTARLGEPESLQSEMLSSQMWIGEAFNPENIENPEGFRTVKKFAGKAKVLLLFVSHIPRNFPGSGSFWLMLPSVTSISKKIREILNNPPPLEDDYQYLEKLWPILKAEPSLHHHKRHHENFNS